MTGDDRYAALGRGVGLVGMAVVGIGFFNLVTLGLYLPRFLAVSVAMVVAGVVVILIGSFIGRRGS